MSVRIARITQSRAACLVVGLFLLLILFSPAFGETDFGRILGIEDKGELNSMIDEAKKAIEKNPEDKDSLIKLGIAYHNLGDFGESTAPKESVKYLKRAKKLYPDDALIGAVLGSSTTMMGKYAKDKVTEGRKLVNKGGALLDRAVASAPDDALVRIIRANNSRGLPKLFGRRHYFKEDLLHVEKLIDKSPSAYNEDLKAQVYYRLGAAYNDEGDIASAKLYFKKAVEIAPNSLSGKKAQRTLENL
jgi:tetratricopeptide (TPR) repeat protein